jgi:HTH-type transcriptional regulator / antitoxin HigA
MIRNERQYKITKSWSKKFAQTLQDLQQQPRPENVHPQLWQAEQDALQSQLEEFTADLQAYEALKSGAVKTLALDSLEKVGLALIQARIAKGYTQKELAKQLGVKEQQVQQDEESLYTAASIRRVAQIAEVLGVRVHGRFELTY